MRRPHTPIDCATALGRSRTGIPTEAHTRSTYRHSIAASRDVGGHANERTMVDGYRTYTDPTQHRAVRMGGGGKALGGGECEAGSERGNGGLWGGEDPGCSNIGRPSPGVLRGKRGVPHGSAGGGRRHMRRGRKASGGEGTRTLRLWRGGCSPSSMGTMGGFVEKWAPEQQRGCVCEREETEGAYRRTQRRCRMREPSPFGNHQEGWKAGGGEGVGGGAGHGSVVGEDIGGGTSGYTLRIGE